MDYNQPLKYHYRPKKGWINDPNGLVYFQGYYHIFYQHSPDFEVPCRQPMHWGHARTKDFLHFEELPVALYPDKKYDDCGCWSGTAIQKDGRLYLFYASIHTPKAASHSTQTVSVAYSDDGIEFHKYEGNPVIAGYPADGSPDFRDPAVCCIDGVYYCVMASGHEESKTGRLLLYKSEDLLNWNYLGIMSRWENSRFTECPSFMTAEQGTLLAASVCPFDATHYFSVMFGRFEEGKFHLEHTAEVDKGPDQYAGQIFKDHKGRNLMITWIPGWGYEEYAPKDIGCMSIPREIRCVDGKITAYPIKELQYLLKDEDDAVKRSEDGFVIARQGRAPIVYRGKIEDLKILRDGYVIEVFVNGGQEVYTALL